MTTYGAREQNSIKPLGIFYFVVKILVSANNLFEIDHVGSGTRATNQCSLKIKVTLAFLNMFRVVAKVNA